MSAEDQLKRLRLLVKRRIDVGEFTASELAIKLGLSEPTISNFVNGRRGAKRSTVDLYKNVLGISDLDLSGHTPLPQPASATIPVVRHFTAISAASITRDLIVRDSHLEIASLRHFRCKPTLDRENWTRFVAVDITRSQVRFLEPRFTHGAMLFIDRYDQRIRLSVEANGELYAVNSAGFLSIGYLQPLGKDLLLRPNSLREDAITIHVDGRHSAAHFIVGRICHVSMDLGVKS